MNGWRHVIPFLVGLVLFAALAIFNELRGFTLWRNYALSGIAMGGIVVWILVRLDVRLPAYIQISIVAALLSHYGGGSLGHPDRYHMGLLGMHGINGAYHHFPWWDHLTHGVGIAASAMGIAYLLEIYQTRRNLQWSGSSVWIVTMLCAMTAGVGVELYEYLGKTAFQTIDQGGYENTMRDLHFNFIGGAVGAAVVVSMNRTRFRKRIRAQWAVAEEPGPRGNWWQDLTPAMAGLLAFVTLPALAAMALGTHFFTMELPPDDTVLYDPALLVLVWTTAAAVVLAPIVAWLHARTVGQGPEVEDGSEGGA